jgi:YjbE family integral membrane protein
MIEVAASLFLLLQIFFVDLLLGADNAVVIALACSRLPPEATRRAVILGAGGAIALRLVMILFANALLGVPLVKLVGAWMLIVIALNVRAQTGDDAEGSGRGAAASNFMSAAAVIMFADAAMSLDNVVALAAIANGNLWLLAVGILLSIPILVYSAFLLTGILRLAPEIFTLGAAFLGWIAGGMATTDPLVSGWIDANAPALAVFAPALAALFVLAAGKGKARWDTRPVESAPRPRPRTAAPFALARALPQEAISVSAGAARFDSAPPRVASPPTSARPRAEVVPPVGSPSPAAAIPEFAPDEPAAASGSSWTEERLVVAGFLLLAFLAGLIIFIASFFDSLT